MGFRDAFWSATVVGQVIFLIGVAAVNARKGLKDKMLWFDVMMSLAHLVLLKAYKPLGDAVTRRAFGGHVYGSATYTIGGMGALSTVTATTFRCRP